jgi:hypothetical protein
MFRVSFIETCFVSHKFTVCFLPGFGNMVRVSSNVLGSRSQRHVTYQTK